MVLFTILFCCDGAAFAQVLHERLKSFGFPDPSGANPLAAVIEGQDGALYGTTRFGGSRAVGTVFKVNKDGTGHRILKSFGTGMSDGQGPYAALVQDGDGVLYGTTTAGGSGGVGTIFKIKTNGTDYAVLYHFNRDGKDGTVPSSPLLRGSDGALYGTTLYGGSKNIGTVFKINPDGSNYRKLYELDWRRIEGENPVRALIRGTDGTLYGTTGEGGMADVGTVFKINTDGSGYAKLHEFKFGNGEPRSP